jgi:membrane associated rhomboid family serine protease
MKRRLLLYNFSITILLFTLVIYLVDYLLHGTLSSLFSLKTDKILINLELWRIFTFPFVAGSIESVLLFIFTFYSVGQKLELILEKAFYPILLFLLVCLQGTIFTLVFHKYLTDISGMEGLSFFILTLYAALKLREKSRNDRYKRTLRFVSILVITWICAKVLHNSLIDNYELMPAISSIVFGILSGLFIYLQMFLVKRMKSTLATKDHDIDIPKPEELSMALIAQGEMKKFNQSLQEEHTKYENEDGFTEDRLNRILDKILDKGKDSLTPAELQFLDDYSKSLE